MHTHVIHGWSKLLLLVVTLVDARSSVKQRVSGASFHHKWILFVWTILSQENRVAFLVTRLSLWGAFMACAAATRDTLLDGYFSDRKHTGKDCKHNKQIHGISWTLSLNKREPCREGACAICCWSASYYSAQITLLIQFDWQSLLWVQLCSAFDSATEFDWAWFQNVGLAGLVNLTCSQKSTKRFIWFLKRDPRSHRWSWTGSV